MKIDGSKFTASLLALAVGIGIFALAPVLASSKPVPLPNPKVDAPMAKGDQVAVFAGGCFWGVEAVFEHVKGVKQVSSGYSGGSAVSAKYPLVSSGMTDHAEAVKVVYDPSKVSYGQLLKVFFSVAHDPTQLNRQGPDTGSHYRSEIFHANAAQKQAAAAYITQLDAAKVFGKPIVTKVSPLMKFYPAEAYHQDYARLNPNNPYIVHNDAPKVVHLKKLFPALYKGG